MTSKPQPLDEIAWSDVNALMHHGGSLHSNNVLYYFADSPFFDPTSNNAILVSQATKNAQLWWSIIPTRENFEDKLRSMSGLQFIVAEAPADPVNGTGVWVIRKLTRRKIEGEEDDITIHTTYFVVGERIYQAPNMAGILGSRMATITHHLSNSMTPTTTSIKWTPAIGHFYAQPESLRSVEKTSNPASTRKSTHTPSSNLPPSTSPVTTRHPSFPFNPNGSNPFGTADPDQQDPLGLGYGAGEAEEELDPLSISETAGIPLPPAHFIEESMGIHTRYGTECLDEIPITGAPGRFQLASTGRIDPNVTTGIPNINVPGGGAAGGTAVGAAGKGGKFGATPSGSFSGPSAGKGAAAPGTAPGAGKAAAGAAGGGAGTGKKAAGAKTPKMTNTTVGDGAASGGPKPKRRKSKVLSTGNAGGAAS